MAKNGKDVDYQATALKVGQMFRPSAPIDSDRIFCGRTVQIRDVVDAINQTGRHAIVYGEAGVGKTSLGKILQTKLSAIEPVPIKSPLVTCDSNDNYSSIWNKAFEALGIEGFGVQEEISGEEDEDGSIVLRLEEPEVTPHEVRKTLEAAGHDGILYIIIDEFDKISEDNCRKLIADTIKLLSDRATRATIIVIGVADDVTGLIKNHGSIERCLAQVHMPRMPREELEEIVRKGLHAVGMNAEQAALSEISGLSKGLPHYAHALALYAARAALDGQSLTVVSPHIEIAVDDVIRQAGGTLRDDYDRATSSSRKDTLYKEVLLACAMAEADEFGKFQPVNVCEPLKKIIGKQCPTGVKQFTTDRFAGHLKAFCDNERGPILLRSGTEYRRKYRFKNPLMQPFVTMKGLSEKRISKDDLHLLQDPNGQKRIPF